MLEALLFVEPDILGFIEMIVSVLLCIWLGTCCYDLGSLCNS